MDGKMESTVRRIFRWLAALSFVAIGVQHFVDSAAFVMIVPDYLPWPLALVYVSGAFEILGGLGLLPARTRSLAGWGLIALLVAVYPANIYMLTHEIYLEGMPHEKWLLWARMPLQLGLAAWVLWVAGIGPWKPKKSAA
jgi:uncharacterized membrane protein